MYVNEALLAAGKAPDALFVFLHCQRTGGSNMGRWLQKAFAPDEVYSVKSVDDYVQWRDITDLKRLESYKLVTGFSSFKQHPIDRPVVFLGQVRHPYYPGFPIWLWYFYPSE